MTPEVRGRIASIRLELSLPETTEERKKVLVKEAINMVREARGKVIEVVSLPKQFVERPRSS